ncbi:MAG: hypothetical protein LRY46_01055 [Candidatus Pacebacteria bacterium]|nr:hypothetical protein [Candidatus Paceibacterota bacterium]MCD8508413.1 hypothetical protein [Candidatus Paceibacterota bacterium]MCD8563729.1 hypothetical protein [Candidatus Paceibacterota bacterium]
MFYTFLQHIVRGSLLLLPIFIVVWMVRGISNFFDSIIPNLSGISAFLVGIGVLGILGWIAHHTLMHRIYHVLHTRAPLAKHVVTIFEALPFLKKKTSHEPVWIHTGEGQRKIGFLIHGTLPQFALADHSAVLIPSSFSIQSECIIVHNDLIEKMNIEAEPAFFFAVTGGVIDHTEKNVPTDEV